MFEKVIIWESGGHMDFFFKTIIEIEISVGVGMNNKKYFEYIF